MNNIFIALVIAFMAIFTGFVVDGEAKSPEELIQSMDARVSHNYWQNFYQECFAKQYDFSGVEIPKDPGGFETVVIIPQGLSLPPKFGQ